MKNPRKLSPKLREQVCQRAHYLCEYCHTDERWQYVRFTIDHVSSVADGGEDTLENLALACFHCNRRKSNKQTALDPETKAEVHLFNPRSQKWAEHFVWSDDGSEVIPLTDTGRATVALLDLNRQRIMKIRKADFDVGRHPPHDHMLSKLHEAPVFDEREAARLFSRIENTWYLSAIQPQGSRPPLFCVHAAGSNDLIYGPLARHLGLDQPLYGLQARGVDAQTTPLVRVEEMAAYYIKEMRIVQPEGPYLLLGALFGGLVVYEMAQQLLAQGQRVALLAMLNTDCPIYSFAKRLRCYVGYLMKTGTAYFVFATRSMLRKISPKLEETMPKTLTGNEELQKAIESHRNSKDPLIRSVLANLQSEQDYTPAQRTYSGKITYFWARDAEEDFSDNRRAWRKVASGEFELHVIPGDRTTMREEPNIAVLAEKLRPMLELEY